MPDQAKIGLDNQAFRGRLRQSPRAVAPEPAVRRRSSAQLFGEVLDNNASPSDLLSPTASDKVREHVDAFRSGIGANTSWNNDGNPAAMTMALAAVEPQPQAPETDNPVTKRHVMLRVGLLSMAAIIFIIGVTISLQTSHTNSAAAAQMQAILQQLEDQPAAK